MEDQKPAPREELGANDEQYERPDVVDHGDLSELTNHESPGSPLDPHHGVDPHATFSS